MNRNLTENPSVGMFDLRKILRSQEPVEEPRPVAR